jgi:hypothetical protein
VEGLGELFDLNARVREDLFGNDDLRCDIGKKDDWICGYFAILCVVSCK